MKKAIIAGAASAVLAAMPVLGVFADGATTGSSSYTDTIHVNINKSCTFAREAYTSGGVEGNASHKNNGGTWGNAAATYDTLTATVTNSSLTTLGSSQFKVVCNNTAGYRITVETTGLTSSGNTIPNNTTYSNSVSGWSPVYGSTKLVNGSTLKTVEATTDNDTFEVSYSVGVSATQQAGEYEGSATYTFAQL